MHLNTTRDYVMNDCSYILTSFVLFLAPSEMHQLKLQLVQLGEDALQFEMVLSKLYQYSTF